MLSRQRVRRGFLSGASVATRFAWEVCVRAGLALEDGMKKALYILGELSDLDIEWMISVGHKSKVQPGTTLIHTGQDIDALYVVLEGNLSVRIRGLEVAQLGVGEIVGEISFVDSRPPGADVVAIENTILLVIPRHQLTTKLEQDVAFASRFYRAIAVFLASRLRGAQRQLEFNDTQSLEEDQVYDDELDMNVMDTLSLAGGRFIRILNRMMRD